MKRYLLLLSLASLPVFADAQNYLLGKSKDGVEELYIMNVTTSKSTESVTVVDRIKPMQGMLAEFREKAKKEAPKDADKDGLNKLSFYKRKVKFHTKAKAYKILEYSYYDINGKQLQEVEIDEDDAKWLKIPAESLLEAEFKKVSGL